MTQEAICVVGPEKRTTVEPAHADALPEPEPVIPSGASMSARIDKKGILRVEGAITFQGAFDNRLLFVEPTITVQASISADVFVGVVTCREGKHSEAAASNKRRVNVAYQSQDGHRDTNYRFAVLVLADPFSLFRHTDVKAGEVLAVCAVR